MSARISTIAALGRKRELGKGGELLWRVPADMRRMKELTMGHPLIMGRKTYESIGRPLPGRTNIVITGTQTHIAGCEVFSTLEEALLYAQSIETEEIFIFGGAQIYTVALPYTDRLYLTQIDAEDENADAYFPEYEKEFTKVLSDESHEHKGLRYRWMTLERGQ